MGVKFNLDEKYHENQIDDSLKMMHENRLMKICSKECKGVVGENFPRQISIFYVFKCVVNYTSYWYLYLGQNKL